MLNLNININIQLSLSIKLNFSFIYSKILPQNLFFKYINLKNAYIIVNEAKLLLIFSFFYYQFLD